MLIVGEYDGEDASFELVVKFRVVSGYISREATPSVLLVPCVRVGRNDIYSRNVELADRFETHASWYILSVAQSSRGKVANFLDHTLYFLELLPTFIRMRIIAMILQSVAKEQIANDGIVGALYKWCYMCCERCQMSVRISSSRRYIYLPRCGLRTRSFFPGRALG